MHVSFSEISYELVRFLESKGASIAQAKGRQIYWLRKDLPGTFSVKLCESKILPGWVELRSEEDSFSFCNARQFESPHTINRLTEMLWPAAQAPIKVVEI